MNEREEFAFRPWNIAIDRLRQFVLGFAPLKRGKRPAGRETLVRSDQTGFPWRVRIGDAVARRQNIPFLPQAPDGLKQSNPARLSVARDAHSAALPCCAEAWTGRRALWRG